MSVFDNMLTMANRMEEEAQDLGELNSPEGAFLRDALRVYAKELRKMVEDETGRSPPVIVDNYTLEKNAEVLKRAFHPKAVPQDIRDVIASLEKTYYEPS